ncbi:MAG: hypothetical protein M1823_000213 [Watsoniomyces obsoletus]|nr:MAG: hypothetical protein M1823_000213 [Watsoniomyces obsoletus]
MAHFFNQASQPPPPPPPYGSSPSSSAAQNLQFYPTAYSSTPTPGYGPSSGSGGYGPSSNAYPTGSMAFGAGPSAAGGFGASVTGRMGDQGGLRTGWLAAFGTEGYEGEPPLLEELGVNFGHIKVKTLTVLNPFARIDQHIMDDSDLAGPILFFLLFGFFLLFSGKVHFSYIYGLAILGSTSLHLILSLMSPPLHPDHPDHQTSHPSSSSSSSAPATSSNLTFPRSASVLGYCLLPLVLTSLVGIVLPMDALPGYILTSLAIVWCTYSSSGMFCAVGRMRRMRALVAYPLALFYVGFGIMGIFSSRGSGNLAKVTTGSTAAGVAGSGVSGKSGVGSGAFGRFAGGGGGGGRRF